MDTGTILAWVQIIAVAATAIATIVGAVPALRKLTAKWHVEEIGEVARRVAAATAQYEKTTGVTDNQALKDRALYLAAEAGHYGEEISAAIDAAVKAMNDARDAFKDVGRADVTPDNPASDPVQDVADAVKREAVTAGVSRLPNGRFAARQ